MRRSSVSSARSSIPSASRCASSSSGSSGRRAREQPFVHTRDEDAAESHAARFFDAADPHLAVARTPWARRAANSRRGPSTSSTSDSATGPMSDMGSSSSSSATTRSGSRSVNSARSTRAAIHSPHAARAGRAASCADHGQREAGEILQGGNSRSRRRRWPSSSLFAIAAVELFAQAGETRLPALQAADDGGVHQQAFPGGGRARLASSQRAMPVVRASGRARGIRRSARRRGALRRNASRARKLRPATSGRSEPRVE